MEYNCNHHKHEHNHEDSECCCCHQKHNNITTEYILYALGTALFFTSFFVESNTLKSVINLIAYIFISYEMIISAFKNLLKGLVLDENFLMIIAAIGALLLKEYAEGFAVLALFRIGEYLQHRAVKKSRKNLEAALMLKPDKANLIIDNEVITVNPQKVKIGDIICVKKGEKIPLDGTVIKGKTVIDTSAITGEHLPRSVSSGSDVISGCINLGDVIYIEVTKDSENSSINKIINMVIEASKRKSETEKLITKFAKIYTPIIVVMAFFVAFIPPLFFNGDFLIYVQRALVFLVSSCPCALVISIPLAYFCGVGVAGKNGIILKGGNVFDSLNKLNTIVFDKTGTLTEGNFKISKTEIMGNYNKNEIMDIVASVEGYSNHFIAAALKTVEATKKAENFHEYAGMGVTAEVEGKFVAIGNEKLMNKYNVDFELQNSEITTIYVAVDRKLVCIFEISDSIKKDTKKALQKIKKLGVGKTVMLTGDSHHFAEKISNELKITEYYAELLPSDKVDIFNKVKQGVTAFVGDGINDAPVLAISDVSIAMGKGADISVETADVVLLYDDINQISKLIKLSHLVRKIVISNITFSLFVKFFVLALGLFGLAQLWMAVFADIGIALLAVLNAVKIHRIKI